MNYSLLLLLSLLVFFSATAQGRSYTVKVQTSDDLGAGTDSDVFIRIIGQRGTTKAFDLDNLWGHNDFEQNNLDTFTVNGKDVGHVTGVDLKRGSDYGVGATWIPAWVQIDTYPKIGFGYEFRANVWYHEDYTVKVQTSDDLGAGTDSDVFIRIIGQRGTTKAFDLDNLWGHNDFEQNSLDTFTVDGKDVGHVTGVDLKRGDDYGVGATWTPAWVQIDSYPKIGFGYEFRANVWYHEDVPEPPRNHDA